jgi:GntR family transcriptional regulator, transcriptional repressor for pyruvate dehydrogenase complex
LARAFFGDDNKLMQNLMEVICEFVLAQIARTTLSQKDNQLGGRMRNASLKAIDEHDPDAAESALRKHMQAVIVRLEKQA